MVAAEETRSLFDGDWPEPRRVFREPWQARAFAMTIALSERGLFSLREFQAALVNRVHSFEKSACLAGTDDYYTTWIQALEDLLASKDLLPEGRLAFFEHLVVDDAESRKLHQHMSSRDESGLLRIEPISVDWGLRS